MKAAGTWRETLFLGVIYSCDVAHEFTHCVSVEPGRSEGMLGNKPPGWKDHEIKDGLTWVVGLNGQHCEDRRVWMVEGDATNCAKEIKVVLKGIVVAVPCDYVKGRVILFVFECLAVEASNH